MALLNHEGTSGLFSFGFVGFFVVLVFLGGGHYTTYLGALKIFQIG